MSERGPGRVIVLARAPSAPGKTRLTAGLAPASAAALRRALLADTVAEAAASGGALSICYTPEAAASEVRDVVRDAGFDVVTFEAQADGDLGDRMRQAFAACFAAGDEHAVLIGSDLPSLPSGHIVDAVAALVSPADVVLGPSEDGGYYLVGVSRTRADAALDALFSDVPWGSADVLARTLARLRAAGLLVELVAPWFDVDSAEDLARIAADSRPDAAPRTRAWIAATPARDREALG
jgi:uncharacterized protein